MFVYITQKTFVYYSHIAVNICFCKTGGEL